MLCELDIKKGSWNGRQIVKRVVANNSYMEDILSSFSDEEILIGLSLLLIPYLKTFGFRLTEWVSDSKVILENISYLELSPKFINLDLNS